MLPSQVPKQLASVADNSDTESAVGSPIVVLNSAVQALASVAVMLYVPAHRFSIRDVLAPLSQS
ncbi:MAG: hypothetical protein C0594_16125 [Marinilabiliales bacterium]|nr:MAG: hypothetical protein C0594_16125 [Marinilabiliales bacterium]